MWDFLSTIGHAINWVYNIVKFYLQKLIMAPVAIIAYVWASVTALVHWLFSVIWDWISDAFLGFFGAGHFVTEYENFFSLRFPLLDFFFQLTSLETLFEWFEIWLSAGLVALSLYLIAVSAKWITRVIP